MLAAVQILSGLFLLCYLILPDQNYELISWLCGGAAAIWVLFFATNRSRNLLSPAIFFYCCLLVAFHVRVSSAAGWMIHWYMFCFWTQWIIVLWFAARNEIVEVALFVTVVLISPLYWPILHVRNPAFYGLSLWIVAISHSIWLLRKEIRLEWSLIVLLLASLLPVPFAVYGWRAMQFFWIQSACILLYSTFIYAGERRARPLIAGCLFLCLSLGVYTLFNDFFTVRHSGISVLAMRHHILEHANTLAPLYIIVSSILLYLLSKELHGRTKFLVIASLAILAVLEFLTYSRNGWFAYVVMILSYAVLLAFRKQKERTPLRKRYAIAIVAIPLLILLLFPVQRAVFERVSDRASISSRVFTWELGWHTVRQNLLFGVGWFNHYVHAAEPADGPLNDLARNISLRDVHNHSLFLDLAEAGGLPLVLSFIAILVIHFRRAFPTSALIAGLIAVTMNNLLDTAALWLTVYPHFWILMALANRPSDGWPHTWNRIALIITGVLLFVGAGILYLIEDHSLQRAIFFHRTSNDSKAIAALNVARFVAPYNVLPLEALLDIHLSRRDSAASAATLEQLMKRKKNYAPYYTQMAQIDLASGNFTKASNHLKTAEQLDPYMALQGKTYLLLSDLHRRQGSLQYRANLYRFLMTRIVPVDFKARELMDTIEDDEFLKEAFDYVEKNANVWDRPVAIRHLHQNLLHLHKPDLAAYVLETAVKKGSRFLAYEIDTLAYALAKHYGNRKSPDKMEQLIPYTPPEALNLVRAHHEIARRNSDQAVRYLMRASTSRSYYDMSQTWEAYWRAIGSEEGLRTHFKILQRLPTFEFNPWWQQEIARSFMRQKMYDRAAAEFHKLALYDYSNPAPHWWESRMLHLYGDPDAARANARFNRFVPKSNLVYENLYTAELLASAGQDVAMIRTGFKNDLGGVLWRTGIFAHAPAVLKFPAAVQFQSIGGHIAFLDGASFLKTDGAKVVLQNHAGTRLTSMQMNPKIDPSVSGGKAFRWEAEAPQTLVLQTHPLANSSYDWVLISIDIAR